jgi:hypothetical protein
MYTQVLQGAIDVQNAAGSIGIESGHGTFVRSFNALPVSVLASTLPAVIFAEILAVPLGASAAAAAALVTDSGLSSAAMIGIGLGVVGVAAAASGGSNSTTNH